MISLQLLEALGTRATTVSCVVSMLGISGAEASRQLSAATASGLVGGDHIQRR